MLAEPAYFHIGATHCVAVSANDYGCDVDLRDGSRKEKSLLQQRRVVQSGVYHKADLAHGPAVLIVKVMGHFAFV